MECGTELRPETKINQQRTLVLQKLEKKKKQEQRWSKCIKRF